jgi:hypothetical protein
MAENEIRFVQPSKYYVVCFDIETINRYSDTIPLAEDDAAQITVIGVSTYDHDN